MKNKIYPFLLGLSCIVIVALVSFKNSEKAVEKEQMIIRASCDGDGINTLFISTSRSYEKQVLQDQKTKAAYDKYTLLLKKIEEYQKSGWVITSSNFSYATLGSSIYYSLERDKQ